MYIDNYLTFNPHKNQWEQFYSTFYFALDENIEPQGGKVIFLKSFY
jgi:hypothetical protein